MERRLAVWFFDFSGCPERFRGWASAEEVSALLRFMKPYEAL